MTHSYQITGMTCNNCVAKVKSELLKLGDVLSADVKLTYPQATITMQKHIPLHVLQNSVSKAGESYQISETDSSMSDSSPTDETETSYYPIILIFAYITGVGLLVQIVQQQFHLMQWMSHFMAGFFLTFSFFKLMNLKGFSDGYQTYDLVAKKFPVYGFIYPFIELALGISYLVGFNPLLTNIVAFVVMGVSTIGVAQSLLKKTKFQCACLGTVFKLPLGKVTFFEDILMVVMSGIMAAFLL